MIAGTVEWPSIKIRGTAFYLDSKTPIEDLTSGLFSCPELGSLTAFDTLLSNYYKQNLAGSTEEEKVQLRSEEADWPHL